MLVPARRLDLRGDLGRKLARHERGKRLARGHELIDAARRLLVLLRSIAEAKLVDALVHLHQRARARGLAWKEIHDDQHALNVLSRTEGVDGVAERGVVDQSAIPISVELLPLLDVGPG